VGQSRRQPSAFWSLMAMSYEKPDIVTEPLIEDAYRAPTGQLTTKYLPDPLRFWTSLVLVIFGNFIAIFGFTLILTSFGLVAFLVMNLGLGLSYATERWLEPRLAFKTLPMEQRLFCLIGNVPIIVLMVCFTVYFPDTDFRTWHVHPMTCVFSWSILSHSFFQITKSIKDSYIENNSMDNAAN
jgi:hypothetical protein